MLPPEKLCQLTNRVEESSKRDDLPERKAWFKIISTKQTLPNFHLATQRLTSVALVVTALKKFNLKPVVIRDDVPEAAYNRML